MPLASQTTAEHVMGAVEALVVNGGPQPLILFRHSSIQRLRTQRQLLK